MAESAKHVSLAFVGDVMCHTEQLNAAAVDVEKNLYDFSFYFAHMREHTAAADISVCNLETTLPGSDYAGYPRFRTPDALADAIAEAGFTIAATANNHTYDSGLLGVRRTVQVLKAAGLRSMGTRENPEDDAFVIVEANGLKVGLLNFTYGTALKKGVRTLNNRALDEESRQLVNSFCYEILEDDLELVEAEVKALRDRGADVVVPFFHWGNEYERHSNVLQRYFAWRVANMGVDAIVGGHAHVPQEQDVITVESPFGPKDVPVFYGLGNYIWGGRPSYERETVMDNVVARLNVEKLETGEVRVSTSHVPMRICMHNGKPEVFDLKELLSAPERAEVEALNDFDTESVIARIDDTLHKRPATVRTVCLFDKIFQLKAGEVVSVLDFLTSSIAEKEGSSASPNPQWASFSSEDAIIASALQNGRIVGNVPGYTGITATASDGSEYTFMIRVIEGASNALPVVVNEFNVIRDIYNPDDRVTGAVAGLPEKMSARRMTAAAWRSMKAAARSENVELSFRDGFRTKVSQHLRRQNYAKANGAEAASRRYQKPGRSEHLLGVAIDVAEGSGADKAAVFSWVRANAWKFGFLARPNAAPLAIQAYVHLRYLGDVKLAKYLTAHGLGIEEWLEHYEDHVQPLQDEVVDLGIPEVGEIKPATVEKPETGALRGSFTLASVRDLALAAGVEFSIPLEFAHMASQPLAHVFTASARAVEAEGPTLLILTKYDASRKAVYAKCAKNGVVVVSDMPVLDTNGAVLPSIVLPSREDVRTTLIAVASCVKELVTMPTLAITASVGKTTTTLFMEAVLGQAYKVFVTGGNLNSYHLIGEAILERYDSSYTFHVQEVGGGSPLMAERSARMLHHDAFVIGNIYPHHLDYYGTVDNIVYDKASLDRWAKDGAFGIINWDDDVLRNYPFQHRIVSVGIEHKEADYVANNVRQDGVWLKMDISCKKDGRVVPIEINIPGLHNAYNALCTFAMAAEWGLSDQVIQAGFRAYESGTIRQALHEVSGRIVYMDCFNANVNSIQTSLSTLSAMTPKNNGRRIAILSGGNHLGDQAYSVNYDLGTKLGNYDVDEYIFYGPDESLPLEAQDESGLSRPLLDGAMTVIPDKPMALYDNVKDVAEHLARVSGPDDIILIKGSCYRALYAICDLAFGTSFAVYEPYHPGVVVRGAGKAHGFTARSYSYLDHGANLRTCTRIGKKVVIPDEVCGKPVFRLGKLIFAKAKRIVEVDFGHSVVNIGAQAFSGCSSLQAIHVPASVKHVEKSAFWGCTALVEAEFEAVQQLEKRVFANCKNLRVCRIPATCLSIGDGVFTGCKNVTIQAPEGSVAQAYALANGIPFEVWEPAAE